MHPWTEAGRLPAENGSDETGLRLLVGQGEARGGTIPGGRARLGNWKSPPPMADEMPDMAPARSGETPRGSAGATAPAVPEGSRLRRQACGTTDCRTTCGARAAEEGQQRDKGDARCKRQGPTAHPDVRTVGPLLGLIGSCTGGHPHRAD